MKIRKFQLMVGMAAGLVFADRAHAAVWFEGSFGTFNEGGGSYSSSSVDLLADNFVNGSIGGGFVGILPQYSLISTYSTAITGLSTTPLSDPITDFFQIASPGNPFGLNGAGTTPTANRFDFDLATITETSYNPTFGIASFSGTGTLVDNSGAFASTPADFTLNFSGANSYSFTLGTAVPETSTILSGALLLLPLGASALRIVRRRQAA